MKKIIWVTSECFTETDYNYKLFEQLCKIYIIDWYVVFGQRPYLPKCFFSVFRNINNLNVHICDKKYRDRDFRTIPFYIQLFRMVYSSKSDIIYFNYAPNPFFGIFANFYSNKQTIYCAHDGMAQNDSSKWGMVRKFSYDILYKHARYVNMFSIAQSELMKKSYPNVKIHTMVLPLKDFGHSEQKRPKNLVRFLCFGNIIYQKNIELLIEAANLLYEKGYRNFRVSINGSCSNWDYYKSFIKYEEIFELAPFFVPNSNLLTLFATSHYAVFPYRRVSQSGVLKIAFNYNLPVIVSNIGSFKEEVVNDVNGYFFKNGDVDSLVSVMENAIVRNREEYQNLLCRMKKYTDSKYSLASIVSYYSEMFENFVQ